MRFALAFALVFGVGCGSTPPPDATPAAASDSSEVAEPVTEDTPAPGYTVHEWGLIDVGAYGPVEVAAGPGQPDAPLSVRKPVLYVQLDPGLDALTFAARVQVPGGSIVEHWPEGAVTADAVEWARVDARRCDAATRESNREATRDLRGPSRACATPDGYCEVYDLPGYVADGSACLRVGSEEATLLFYRASLPSVTLPYRVSRDPAGAVVVEATRPLAAPVGALWRLRTETNGVLLSRVDAPTSGTVTLPAADRAPDRVADRALLGADLAALGLTAAEAEAFLRAWSDELFGASAAPTRRAARVTEHLLYWLPREDVDRIAPLTLTPPPRELRRAILVRSPI